jgi:DNA-binding CsgD family transcriptional regulator
MQMGLKDFAHAQPESLEVIDLQGQIPTRETMASIVQLLRRDGTVLVINAYRRSAVPERPTVQWTRKEALVVAGILRGLRNRQIAGEVGTTEQVIKNMCRDIFRKAKVRSRQQLILVANPMSWPRYWNQFDPRLQTAQGGHTGFRGSVSGGARGPWANPDPGEREPSIGSRSGRSRAG